MRNIGRYRYKVSIEEPTYSPNSIGASDKSWTLVKETRADIRYTRYGGGGTKRNDGVNEFNSERIEFNLTPQDIRFDWSIVYKGVRYEIAAIQSYFDRTAVVCFGTPQSSAENVTQ
jgi:hypothetical protein